MALEALGLSLGITYWLARERDDSRMAKRRPPRGSALTNQKPGPARAVGTLIRVATLQPGSIARNFATAPEPQGRNIMEATIREARLKPQYASLYPALEAGTWQPASAIGRQLLLWHLTVPTVPEGERLMSEEHFEFRGGARRADSEAGARTRAADRPQPRA